MKEQIHTIPIHDAMENAGECPFCYIKRRTEEHAMNYVLGPGASYMEADVRDMTDTQGFCQDHLKKMFIYGNSLGNAWIVKTLTQRHLTEMEKELKAFKPDAAPAKKGGFFSKKAEPTSTNSIVDWINRRESTCFTCKMIDNTFNAYLKTFFNLYKKEDEFRKQVAASKGFCLDHFKTLLEGADEYLKGQERTDFYNMILPLMKSNMERVYEDVSWFIERYNNNPEAEGKNYQGSIQRAMQKLRGQDPSLPDMKTR